MRCLIPQTELASLPALVGLAWQVVYLTEVIDEPMFNHLEKFDGHTLIDVAREGVDLGDTEEEKQEVRPPSCWAGLLRRLTMHAWQGRAPCTVV